MKLDEFFEVLSPETRVNVERIARARHLVTMEELLTVSLEEIKAFVGFKTVAEASNFISELSYKMLAKLPNRLPATSSEVHPQQILSTGCGIIDSNLGNSPFRVGNVIEVSGESASGKTQLVLQLLTVVQLPLEQGGLNGTALLIESEGTFPQNRFEEISENFRNHLLEMKTTTTNFDIKSHDFLSSVKVIPALQTNPNQLPALFSSVEELCERFKDIKLVVIDSIAALYRSEFGKDDAIERAHGLWSIAYSLHRIASKGICVVIINQVSDDISNTNPSAIIEDEIQTRADFSFGNEISSLLKSKEVRPALGFGWSNCINVRIQLSRTFMDLGNDRGVARKVQVVFSPTLPQSTSFFCVDASGIHGLKESDLINFSSTS